jgi:hypothetical protein
MNWVVRALKGHKLKAILCRLRWSATVYNIFGSRGNDINY